MIRGIEHKYIFWGCFCILSVFAGCDAQRDTAKAWGSISWVKLDHPDQMAGVSIALWTPAERVKRGSMFAVVAVVRNDTGRPLVVPQDLMGRLAVCAILDGGEEKMFRFEYMCPLHNHPWTLMPGDTIQRIIPVLTDNARERWLKFENIHEIPLPVDASVVGVDAGHCSRLILRLCPMIEDGKAVEGQKYPEVSLFIED